MRNEWKIKKTGRHEREKNSEVLKLSGEIKRKTSEDAEEIIDVFLIEFLAYEANPYLAVHVSIEISYKD